MNHPSSRTSTPTLVRPPPAETIRDRIDRWRTAGHHWLATRREWRPPEAPVPSISNGAAGSFVSAALVVIVVGAAGLGGAWGWHWWSTRSAPVVEQLLPVVSSPQELPGPAGAVATGGPQDAAAVAEAEPVAIVVHVAGAVRSPGIVEVAAGARVYDAVLAAGGAIDDADLDRINLAAPLSDGQLVYVVSVEEVAPIALVPVGGAVTGTDGEAETMININSADARQLEALPGVGPATAAAIVNHREKRGPFLGVEDLLDVPGIGPAKLATMEGQVTLADGVAPG